jgi:hypothetical protein
MEARRPERTATCREGHKSLYSTVKNFTMKRGWLPIYPTFMEANNAGDFDIGAFEICSTLLDKVSADADALRHC